MSCPSTRFNGREDANVRWQNWVGRVSGQVTAYFEPDSLADLVELIMRAERDGHKVRVVGSGWAFESIAYSPDWMVCLKRLNKVLDQTAGLLRGVVETCLNAEWRARRQRGEQLVHVEAGIRVADLSDELDRRGLALPTLGGANGQALAGVINTSTHGGDIDFGPFPDLVVAMHVVTVGGREIWVERGSAPVTDDHELAQTLACKDLEIIRDDELFNAMLVGLGRFGVVYSYVLHVTTAFRLAEWTVRLPRVVVMPALREGVVQGTFLQPLLNILPDPPHALETIDPKRPRNIDIGFDTRNLEMCWVRRRWPTTNPNDFQMVDQPMPLCSMGTAGIHALINGTLTAFALATMPLNPVKGVAIDAERARIAEQFRLNPSMAAGEMFAQGMMAGLNLQADWLINALTGCVFGCVYKDSMLGGRRGRADVVISGFRSASEQNCYRADSVEPAFDAHREGYLDFLDWVFAEALAKQQAGYLSLRWSTPSRATISHHNFETSHVVSVEVTSMKGMRDNAQWMTRLEELAASHGGRPHWGQINERDAAELQSIYGGLFDRWRARLAALAGASEVFSSPFSVERGLEPPAGTGAPTLFGRKLSEIVPVITPPIASGPVIPAPPVVVPGRPRPPIP